MYVPRSIALPVRRFAARWKMSQNRTPEEIHGVARGLGAPRRAEDPVVAAIVEERRPPRDRRP